MTNSQSPPWAIVPIPYTAQPRLPTDSPGLTVSRPSPSNAYEIFPALWPIDCHLHGLDIVEQGLGFSVEPVLRRVYDDRQWHSSVTYVRLCP
jgi:hypothetical protein